MDQVRGGAASTDIEGERGVSDKYLDAGSPPAGAWFTAHRLKRCPNTGDWCTSSCSYNVHASVWTLLRKHDAADIDGFLQGLAGDLLHGENHAIDISRHDGEGFDNWRWIDRGDDVVDVDACVAHIRGLLTNHLRLRLYKDDHRVETEAA